MAAKPPINFGQFLRDVLAAPYNKDAMRRALDYDPPPRRRFPSPCEQVGCQDCDGEDCDCECHQLRKEEEPDAEMFAYKLFPAGCLCHRRGTSRGDCDWCHAKEDWLLNDPE